MDLKPPLSYEEQVSKLIEHHMSVDDKRDAAAFLSYVNYYRFTGYALEFRAENGQDYRDRTTFENVQKIYQFDTELRGILRDALDVAETCFRAHIATGFAMVKCKDAPYDGHYHEENFYRRQLYAKVMESLQREEKRQEESLVIRHHKTCYNDRLPLWVIVEMLSFSSLSTLYAAMYISEQNHIAAMRHQTAKVMQNHLHLLTVLRNKCCHSGRLYNVELRPPAMLGSRYLQNHPEVKCDTLFAAVLVLFRNLPTRESQIQLDRRLCACITKYSSAITLDRLGFPENYRQLMAIEENAPQW